MTMADNTIYDLLDEVNCADSCEAVTALCELIDELLKDIQHLELECISTRYLLSRSMDEDQGRLLRSDSWKIWDTGTTAARHISCSKHFSMTAGIPWNSATILSRYKKPVKANGHAGTNQSLKRRLSWGIVKSFPGRHSRR